MPQPSVTNCPHAFLSFGVPFGVRSFFSGALFYGFRFSLLSVVCRYVQCFSGGYSAGVPPLPIPNREVKPVRADGTA